MSIPPRFAEIFCKTKRYAIYFSCFITESAKYPSGKNVISAISFAIIIEPMKVMVISSIKSERIFPAKVTSFRAKIVKNLMFLKAHITARVKNKQERVFKSKYPRYSLSGGTKNPVTIAASAAIQNTRFFFTNLTTFKSSPTNKI